MISAQPPQPLSGVHLSLLGLAVVISIVSVWWIQGLSSTRAQLTLIRIAGWMLLALSVFQLIWLLLPENWNIGRSLPLHYSDALRFITAIALIWRVRWAAAVSYYWGLTLNTQAIVTPHPTMLVAGSMDFYLYWTLHIFVLVAPLVLVWGVGFRPRWKDFGAAYALAIFWAVLAMGINAMLGTNYGFVSRPPDGVSLVDWLGSWPIYVLWMAAIAAALWALMTWPWVRRVQFMATSARLGCPQTCAAVQSRTCKC